MTVTSETSQPTFSAQLREASWGSHEKAAESPFMSQLLAGDLDRRRYAELVAQHRFAYVVLEDAASVMAHDAVAGAFVAPELTRLPALDADLAWLLGDDWSDQIAPSAATIAYCERLKDVCYSWPGGFVAHHYTRYLGDLSGGQFIRRVVERTYQLPDQQGVQFYVFDQIAEPKAFKERYRQLLDAAPWDTDERERVIAEILLAYRLNAKVLEDLA